ETQGAAPLPPDHSGDYERQEGPSRTLDELDGDIRNRFGRLEGPSFDQRQRKAQVAAALFADDPVESVTIGRFTVIRRLGAGGMGVVYVAYDEQLDRRVAVKLLRGPESEQARLDLEREAKTMASLSHPNVVTVHEVGNHHGQVFVAMEYVEGQDLRGWLAARAHGWREVLAIFRQAGEGLAAAHEAGIVHRDFKPDNVLVGKDGRVRVADFGLAYKLDNRREVAEAKAKRDDGENDLQTMRTQIGSVVGTPAYMAPEQYKLSRIDERSDQFAFCVALWEGLYGQRPFIGANIIALSDSIIEGRRRPAPTDKGVPLWLQDILIRGLHPDPPARWPSMRSLLDALAVDPQERRRRLLRNLGVAGLTSIALVGLTLAAVGGANDSARRGYWNLVTGSLLEIEQDRGLAQAVDDAMRARDATRVSASRRFIPSSETAKQEDPTMAAALLREVEGPAGESETWLSMANEVLGGPLSRAILRGHQNLVTKLVFSADGQVLYSGSSDGEVWRWQLDSGRGEKIIEHEGEVTGLALGGGETLYSVGKDGWARSWSPAAGSAQLFWSEAPLTHVDIDPRGGRILLAGKDGVVRSVALADPQDVVDFVGHRGAVRVARHSPSGTYVASGADDNSLRLWRSSDGAPVAVLEGHESGVFHLHFIDEDTLVSGADDGTVRLWRL
ncbi:MAG: protein kinase, partial [Myxococcales bacterium]|nr:protein kinase [Myxococcales bacterium]